MSACGPTPWGARRIALGGAHLLFGRMHEDASVDEAVLAGACRVFAIASAGDTALRLARWDRRVTAVDVRPAQVAYVRARAAGHGVRYGSVDRLLAVARLAGRLAGWDQEQLRRFLLLDDPQSQARAFDQLLRTRRCRALLAAGLDPVVLRLGYAAPFVSVLPQRFAHSLSQRLRAGFATHRNRHNPYAWRLLLGVDPPGHEEPLGRPAQGLVVELGEAAAFLERQPAGSFDGFTLSNILDGPDRQYSCRLAAAVRHAGRPGAPVVLRTLRDARNQDEASHALQDRALLWGAIIVAAAEDLIDHVDWS
jgi:S-adenosylmethionine:diacylglycerol 3-amino-3-carboxypropyl transferase